MIIKTTVERIRDPFMLVENGVYYLYGTGNTKGNWNDTIWACLKNETGKLDGKWEQTENIVYTKPQNAIKNFWAPEVHKYNGAFYMFATYYSSLTNHRGCSILKSDSPLGPFNEITNGHVTPSDIDAIDATFYVDSQGQPWIVFVHEWTCTPDGVGRMAVAKLSADLTHMISQPQELFRADDPAWTNQKVTDGCFMYTANNGELLMIWSNFAEEKGYCVGVARSKNGKIDGEWVQDEELLFSKDLTGEYDGGHGMIFKDTDGKMYLCVHSPNTPTEQIGERTVFIPIEDNNGKLKCII